MGVIGPGCHRYEAEVEVVPTEISTGAKQKEPETSSPSTKPPLAHNVVPVLPSAIGSGSTATTGTNSVAIGNNASTSTYDNSVALGNGATAGADNVIIFGDGTQNVGIGTTSPLNQLHVETGNFNTGIRLTTSSGSFLTQLDYNHVYFDNLDSGGGFSWRVEKECIEFLKNYILFFMP